MKAALGTGIQALISKFSVNFSPFRSSVMILVIQIALFLTFKRTSPLTVNFMIIINLSLISIIMKTVTHDQIQSIYL